jgi:hypothetical protein
MNATMPAVNAPLKQRSLRAVLTGLVLMSLFAFFFVYPGHDPKPNDLPVAADIPLQIEGVDVKPVQTAEQGRQMILDREVYAAIVEGRMLISTAASFTVAERFRTFDPALQVQDVRPLDRDDPRGTAIGLLILPLVITGILSAGLLSSLAPDLDLRGRLLLSALVCALGGLVTMAIVRLGIGALPGSYLALSGVAALTLLAANLPSGGLLRIIGPPGVGLAFVLFLMLGSPSSGATSAPELLPSPWAEGGQFLQAGAGATAIRNTAYFDGTALALPLIVLVAWCAVGFLLHAIGERRQPSTS